MNKLSLLIVATFASVSSLTTYAAEKIDFGTEIYPILRESCLSCHAAPYEDTKGRMKKPKGSTRLDTPEWIQKGHAEKDGTWEAIIVAGDAEASSFYTLTILPEDHDDIMPAKGDPLTKAQTDLIKNWINSGADFGDFVAPEYTNPRSKEAAAK
ncbi:MAG: hypothetical protein ACSHYA_01145 [Opitutaceae bacterium]